MQQLRAVLLHYGLEQANIAALGNGLINATWKVWEDEDEAFVLQRINTDVFKDPLLIDANHNMLARFFDRHFPAYEFVAPYSATDGRTMIAVDRHWYRLLPFVNDSHTIDVVSTEQQAFEAARQFGKFTALLTDMDTQHLHITLPQFHDLSLRYQQLQDALQHGDPDRIAAAAGTIRKALDHRWILDRYEAIIRDPAFKLRVHHHDTKISNVLFDVHDKGICVIDLDTVMPGRFISDVGDMLRTYLCPVSEEEVDTTLIHIRPAYFKAIASGYWSEMRDVLTKEERGAFVYAGQFMIWMQALRFLTDHLNKDVYYGARYEGHNHIRAINQLTLLEKLNESAPALERMMEEMD